MVRPTATEDHSAFHPPGYRDLEERLRQSKLGTRPGGWNIPTVGDVATPDKGMLSLAFRLGTEILAAMVVGIGGGLLLDSWLGTKPLFFIIGFFVGCGAGVANVYRSVGGLGYAVGYRAVLPTEETKDAEAIATQGKGGTPEDSYRLGNDH